MAFTIRTAVISVTKANDLLQFLEYTAHVFDDFDDTGAAYSGTFGGITFTAAGASSNTINVKRSTSSSTYDFTITVPTGSCAVTAYFHESRTVPCMLEFVFNDSLTSENCFAFVFDTATNLASGQTDKIFTRSGTAAYSPTMISSGQYTSYGSSSYLNSPSVVQLVPLVQPNGTKSDNAFAVLRSSSDDFRGLVDIGGESYYICRNLAMKG